jgi:hypothetical protein
LIESLFEQTLFDRKIISPKGNFTERVFQQRVIWPMLLFTNKLIYRKKKIGRKLKEIDFGKGQFDRKFKKYYFQFDQKLIDSKMLIQQILSVNFQKIGELTFW